MYDSGRLVHHPCSAIVVGAQETCQGGPFGLGAGDRSVDGHDSADVHVPARNPPDGRDGLCERGPLDRFGKGCYSCRSCGAA